MKIDDMLELEAKHYIEARDVAAPVGLKPTRRGHQMETIEIEVEPTFAANLRSIFGYNATKIGAFVEDAVNARFKQDGIAVA
ncbi:MAG: hypothetical protein LBL67_03425 [Coriobacteriales bacterium]|jgi:hypothetical protein|nr:hypothetical protein [Coriobacteriales bacterium]